MKELKVSGKQNFMGVEIPIIEGGFGEDKRVVIEKHIAEIHNMQVKHVRESINRLINKGRLKENIDYIDLKRVEQFGTLDLTLYYAKASLTQAKNLFVLSERGYTKLIKAMDDDMSWEVMDDFVDNYFDMRNAIQTALSERTLAIAGIVDAKTDVERAVAIRNFEDVVSLPLIKTIEKQKPMAALAELRIDKKGCYSLTDATKSLELKKGQITRWAKAHEYIHKKLQEVNKAGEKFFKVYSTDGIHNSIGITEDGLQEINFKLEEISTY